ncbi:MAG: tyrosine-type recombinase/integrase [Faecalibacterium sp.]
MEQRYKIMRKKSLNAQNQFALYDSLKQDFLDEKKYSGLSAASLRNYEYDLKLFLDFLKENSLPLNEQGFKKFCAHLMDSDMTTSSVNHYLRSVRAFLYWAMEHNEVSAFRIKLIRAEDTVKDVYTQEELAALIRPPKATDSFVTWRSWAITNFILGTAAREATVCQIQMRDISFDEKIVVFRHLKNKHVQILPMSDALYSCLRKYTSLWRQNALLEDFLFVSYYNEPLTTNALRHSQTRYNKSRGVEKTSVHLFRHCFVKNWCMEGGNVFKLQKVLGHSTLAMTQHYANLYSDDLRDDFGDYAALDSLKKREKHCIQRTAPRRRNQ